MGISICKSSDLQIDTIYIYTPSITGCVSVICVKEKNQKKIKKQKKGSEKK